MKRCKADAFTLIELLVVVAIISILAGLLLPALTSARQRAQSVVCQQLLKQYSVAARCYANNNNGCPPSGLHDDYHYYWQAKDFLVDDDYLPWTHYIKYYSGKPAIRTMDSKGWWRTWGCPSDTYLAHATRSLQNDYGVNSRTPWLRLHAVKLPSKLIFWGDTRARPYVYYDKDDWPIRHMGGDNFVFYDGHTERWLREKMSRNIKYSWVEGGYVWLALYNGRIYPNGSSYPD